MSMEMELLLKISNKKIIKFYKTVKIMNRQQVGYMVATIFPLSDFSRSANFCLQIKIELELPKQPEKVTRHLAMMNTLLDVRFRNFRIL